MGDILSIFFIIVNSLLLVKYYSDFLSPKSNRLPAYTIFLGFGAIHMILRSLNELFFSRDPLQLPLLSITILISIVFIFSLLFFKKDLGMQLFLIFSFFAVQEICFFMSLSLYFLLRDVEFLLLNYLFTKGFLYEGNAFYISSMVLYGLFMLSYVVSFVLSLKNITKRFVYRKQSFYLSEIFFLILPCLSGLFSTYILRAIIFKPEGNGVQVMYRDIPYIGILIPLTGILLLIMIIASVILFQKLIKQRIEEKNEAVLQNQIQQLQEQIRDVDNIYTEIRGMRHDMKNHLSTIQLLVNAALEGNKDVAQELEEYLGKMGNTLDKFVFAYKTGNPISDVVIHQKYMDAVSKEIKFSSSFIYPSRLALDAYDLAIILNNALENAIEACDTMTQLGRFINIHSHMKGEIFFIEIENSFMGDIYIDEYTKLPTSNKPDKAAHGMGLSNIQRCARKFFGDIDIQISKSPNNGIFRLTIMLQGRV